MIKKIKIPENVEIEVDGKSVGVKGVKGELKRDFSNPMFDKSLSIKKADGEIIISSEDKRKCVKSMMGTIYAHINNMIVGVTKGYKYTLKIYFVHFPMKVELKEVNNETEISIKNFLGEREPRNVKVSGVKVQIQGDLIIIRGIDKGKVGQACNKIESACKVCKRDRRVFNDGIFLVKREVDK